MPHTSPLITTVVVALSLAWALGVVAQRLKLPPLFGYLLAGIAIGPFTPGFVADLDLAGQLAELGVILLMFGVGLHFSWQDLLAVRGIAIPGALAQIACATLLGGALATWFGWDLGAALIFGLALSVASTVVLLRALQERRLVQTDRGRIAVGWLIVEDIVMVFTLVLLPALAGLLGAENVSQSDLTGIGTALGITLAKIVGFVAVMLLVGKRLIPWILHYVAHTGSRELFRLSVFVIALGTAFAAASLFDVSFALGAFFAGMVLSESALSQQAAQETLPLRDAFAVLFFVSAGMLFDPMVMVEEPLAVLATLAIIIIGKSAAAFGITLLAGYSAPTALTISASLAQIGEFSFILANLGVGLALLPVEGRDLILAGAILSILLNPFLFAVVDRLFVKREAAIADAPGAPEAPEAFAREPIRATELSNHIVLVGYGRLGAYIGSILQQKDVPMFVIDDSQEIVSDLAAQGVEAISGNAADPNVITAANLAAARCLLVAVADAFEGGQIVQQAREINPSLLIIARAHSDAEAEHLKTHGATSVVMADQETGKAMVRDLLAQLGSEEQRSD
jgi:K+:H+ antiporter